MVNVSSQNNKMNVTVTSGSSSSNINIKPSVSQTDISASPDTAMYYSEKSREWAIGSKLVDNEDYSSKYYANKAKDSENSAKNYANVAETAYNNIQDSANGVIADIENIRVEATESLTSLATTGVASIENKTSEGVANIEAKTTVGVELVNATKTNAVTEINSTKTTILNDIEFVADGEKKEIEDLADLIKENAEEIASRTSFAMFDTILKDHILTYEETKGLALQGTYVYKSAIAGERYGYPDFYNKCLEEKESATQIEVTLGGKTFIVYKHSNGHHYYDIENKDAIDNVFNINGFAWFYGIDTENERIFLPRNNWFEQVTGDVSEVCTGAVAGLPNIKGTFTSGCNTVADPKATGAIVSETFVSSGRAGGTSSGGYMTVDTFDASESNSIYNNSDTVQPNAVKKLLYICVGNTVSDTSWVDVVTQVEGGVKDLEDATNEGIERLKASSTALTQTQITNCLLEVPQNIKLELNNGVLTLKAGSKVYDGNGLFYEVTSDISNPTPAVNAQVVVMVVNGGLYTAFMGESVSELPANASTYKIFYNTTDKKCYFDIPQGWVECSLPVAICTGTTTNWTSIDQIFNGFGYIGSTVFVLPNVKGLIPNGRNEDGTLKSIEVTTTKVAISTVDANWASQDWFISSNGGLTWYPLQHGQIVYNEETNTWINNFQGGINLWFPFGKTYSTGSKITSFEPKQPFRAVDYSEYVSTPHIIDTYKNGTSWYRVWSDNWCEQGGIITVSTNVYKGQEVTLLKAYKDTNYHINAKNSIVTNDAGVQSLSVNAIAANANPLTNSTFAVALYAACKSCSWTTSGYIA